MWRAVFAKSAGSINAFVWPETVNAESDGLVTGWRRQHRVQGDLATRGRLVEGHLFLSGIERFQVLKLKALENPHAGAAYRGNLVETKIGGLNGQRDI